MSELEDYVDQEVIYFTVKSEDDMQNRSALGNIHAYYVDGFLCGDANSDGNVNIFDVTFLITYLYLEGPPPNIMDAADVNNDGIVNIFDITYLITYLYISGPEPDCP